MRPPAWPAITFPFDPNRANFGNNYNTSIRSSTFGQPNNYLTVSDSIVPHAFRAEMGFQYRF